MSLCSHPLRCLASLCIVISGPLKTDGSFMSFQVKRSRVEPLYSDRLNFCAQNALMAGLVKSNHLKDPVGTSTNRQPPAAWALYDVQLQSMAAYSLVLFVLLDYTTSFHTAL